MKILLMVPPVARALTLELSNEMAQNMGNFPPLGILYLGTYIKKYSGHEVKILDTEALAIGIKEIEEVLKEFRPDVVGITAFTNTLHDIVETAKCIKRILPETVVCIGGPHVALYPKESLHWDEIDYAVQGDGEEAFFSLITLLEDKHLNSDELREKLKEIQGIVLRDKGDVYTNGYARIMDLDSLPIPDRTLLNNDLYFCILGKQRKFTTIMSSRGCPFKCTFCNTPDKLYRYRSANNVVNEIEEISKLGIEELFFFDDLFNMQPGRVIEICDEIKKRKINIHWAFRGRVNGITEELVQRAKEAGCERIQFGIEKGTDLGLKNVKKGTTIAEIVKAVDITKKFGLTAVGNFLIGTPGETREDIMQIINFALKLKLDHAEFNTFIPYPGTPIYEAAVKSGFYKQDHWLDYAKNPSPDFRLTWNETLSDEELNELNVLATKRFYFRPRIFWNELKTLSSWRVLKRKFTGAMIVFKLK